MAGERRTVSLADAYEFGSGLSKPRSDFGFGFPFLSFKDVFDNFFLPAELDQRVNSSVKERATCSIGRGDVFLTRTSETLEELGMSSVALVDFPEATFNGFTKRLRPRDKTIHPEYAGYYFRSATFRQQVYALSNPSTRASLNNEMLARLFIVLPRLTEQKAIGAILKPLDDKIELNRRMSETLEAMTRALFKSWFVDFEPVRAKAGGRNPGLPPHLAALFPDRLVEAEHGELPEGWQVKPLAEIAEFLNGLPLQKYPASDLADSLPVIKIAELRNGISARTDRASNDVPDKYVVKDGNFLFSWSGSLLAKFWTEGEGALNQHLFKVTSERYPPWFFAEWVQVHLEEFQRIAAFKATTMGHIQRKHLQAAMTNCPPDDSIAGLGTAIKPMVDRTIQIDLESRTLAALRDTLLPKLISGQLRVKEPEEFLERTA